MEVAPDLGDGPRAVAEDGRQVGSGAEAGAGPCDDQGPGSGICSDGVDRSYEVLAHLRIDGVPAVGVVEDERPPSAVVL